MAGYLPPVSIPSLSDRNYARDLYGMMSGVGDAFHQNRRDKIGDEQWQQEQTRLQTNADRDYALDLRRLKLDAAGGGNDERFYGSPQWFTRPDGTMGFGTLGTAGTFKEIDAPEGAQWAPSVTYQDLGNQRVPTYTRGGAPAGPGLPVQGDVPTGFQQDGSGGIVPYGGSDPDRERVQAQTQARNRLNAVEMDAESVLGMIDQAEGLIQGGWSTGTTGALMDVPGMITSTSRRELLNTLDGIKANVSFDKLQQMREMSPTGGALGQVSDFENRLLQAVRGPLDPMQPDQMVGTLQNIRDRYEEAVVAHRIAYMTDYQGLPREVANEAIDAIRQGKDPQSVMQRVQQIAGGQ